MVAVVVMIVADLTLTYIIMQVLEYFLKYCTLGLVLSVVSINYKVAVVARRW